jgi:hypothetical protein
MVISSIWDQQIKTKLQFLLLKILALDWELDSDEDVDPSLAILKAIEEDFQ